jgi:hypothetical protein
VRLITYERVTREELIEVIGLPAVVRMEEGGDDWRQLCIHGVLMFSASREFPFVLRTMQQRLTQQANPATDARAKPAGGCPG